MIKPRVRVFMHNFTWVFSSIVVVPSDNEFAQCKLSQIGLNHKVEILMHRKDLERTRTNIARWVFQFHSIIYSHPSQTERSSICGWERLIHYWSERGARLLVLPRQPPTLSQSYLNFSGVIQNNTPYLGDIKTIERTNLSFWVGTSLLAVVPWLGGIVASPDDVTNPGVSDGKNEEGQEVLQNHEQEAVNRSHCLARPLLLTKRYQLSRKHVCFLNNTWQNGNRKSDDQGE